MGGASCKESREAKKLHGEAVHEGGDERQVRKAER